MDVFKQFRAEIVARVDGLSSQGALPAGLDMSRVTVEPPRDPRYGDLSTNAAMVLAKQAGAKPQDIAAHIVAALCALPTVREAAIAGPGFINLRLDAAVWREKLRDVLCAGVEFGRSKMGAGAPINIEFVSANPTGPLHVAHGRGAVFGDVLASLLQFTGFAVTREYYINDAGGQVTQLARSAHWRYREALGLECGAIPEGLYPGDYLIPVAKALKLRHGDVLADAPEEAWMAPVRDLTLEMMLTLIKQDLGALGLEFDVFSSERALVEAGAATETASWLEENGLVYVGVLEPPKGKTPEDWEPRPQTLFKASLFGDDVDRPLKKSDGGWTYFANDIAYHRDKFRRGFPAMINVLGADHGGYVKRMKAAVSAITGGQGGLDCRICQLVHLMEDGAPVKMSKRAGKFVTLRAVIDAVGRDVVRFIMLTRRNDQTLEFDLKKVLEQSKDNPVFYVQYAHARACSVLRHAHEAFPGADLSDVALAGRDLSALQDAAEYELIRRLAAWPRAVEAAAEAHEPHRLAFYMQELAASFHAFWNRGKDDATLRFIHADDPALTFARLALVRGVTVVIASGLRVFGVRPVEEMR